MDTAAGTGERSRLGLWAHVLPDGKIAVDSRIRLGNPVVADLSASQVLAPREPAQILLLNTSAGEYRMFQVVSPLPRKEDSPWT